MRITRRYHKALKNETFAGVVLILGAVLALLWANFPNSEVRELYATISEAHIGPQALHLHLSVSHWASDFLLALFFFIIGMELKQEFVIGSLRDIRQALVPILAAVCGMAGPMGVYVITQFFHGESANWHGWAVPVATDIAFALGVLGLFGRGLPIALRTFLMTLAVVDDLLGILIIAIFFSSNLNFGYLALAFLTIAVFGLCAQKRILRWYVLWPLGIIAWYFMHASGIHATIAGVALGMTIPTIQRTSEKLPLTERLTEHLEFYSAGFILPIFAFFAAGVNVIDSGGVGAMLRDSSAMGIYLGLPVGKTLGISLGVAIMVYVFKLRLGKGLYLRDILAVSMIAGIGFTVSLLIATLSFDANNPAGPHARVAVLLGTAISLFIGAFLLRWRAQWHMSHDAKPSEEELAHRRDVLEHGVIASNDDIDETWGEVPGGRPEVGPGHYDR
ncbi:Na+/H+ antiporter NhaA [Trueperella sp. LYQ141]|uniref:Na+/H+ antiporter NhaA n=1 Tax=Trueperella sp. LYQ141 TaxID=3391058 RepID=UPI0039835A3A